MSSHFYVEVRTESLALESFELTIVGIAIKNKGIFRPKAFVINPKKKLPNKAPMHKHETTHEAFSIVILPDANGESSEVSKIMEGEHHPIFTPYPINKRLTVRKSIKFSKVILCLFLFCNNYPLPHQSTDVSNLGSASFLFLPSNN